jgi:membrane protease YdiL (CAAX protease family)
VTVSPVDAGRSHADPRADRQVVVFGLAAISSSWLLWSPLVAAEWGWIDGDATRYWHLAGSLGPAVAAILLTLIYEGRAGFGLLARRMITGPIPWLLGVVLVPLLVCLVGLGLAKSLGAQVDLSAVGTSEEYPALPVAIYWLTSLTFYGYGEQIGWRGFALPRLQRQRSSAQD